MRIVSQTQSSVLPNEDHSLQYMPSTRRSSFAGEQHRRRSGVIAEQQLVDWQFLLLVGVLATMGLVMVFSASISLSERTLDDAMFYGRNQSIFLLLGIVAATIAWKVPLELWERAGVVLLGIGFFLLLIVLIPGVGKNVNGAQRWIDIGFSIQPSEIFKLAVIVYLAGYFVRHGDQIRNRLSALGVPLGITAGAAVLLLAEPDFGATVVIASTVIAMLFIAGVKLRYFLLVSATCIPLAIALIYTSPYRRTRLLSFINPWDDPFATDFQLTQALIAIGRGSWSGVGLGNSVQKMAYLPEPHTDFVFAVLAEETGLIGVTIVIALFALIVSRCFRIARDAERAGLLFSAHLVTGIGFWFGLQSFINIGANVGILPTKGITLPLFSYGGSSVIMVCAACGLVMRVYRETATHTALELKRSVENRRDPMQGYVHG